MTIQVTPTEWAPIEAAGSGVLFRAGDRCPGLIVPGGISHTWCGQGLSPCHDEKRPPAEFVEAAQPCSCVKLGNRRYVNWHLWDSTIEPTPCEACLDGKRRVAVVVPCEAVCSKCQRPRSNWDSACHCGWTIEGQPPLTRQRTVGHVVVTWGPLVVVRWHERIGSDPAIWLDTSMDGTWVLSLWDGQTSTDIMSEACGGADFPPDIDPQSLVGKYAIGVEVVS